VGVVRGIKKVNWIMEPVVRDGKKPGGVEE